MKLRRKNYSKYVCPGKTIKYHLRSNFFFSNQNEPYTAKLSFSDILKDFWRNLPKKISSKKKMVYIIKMYLIQLNYVFFGVLKHFCGNDQKNILRSKKCFSHQNEPHIAKLSTSVVLKHFCTN